MPQRRKLAKGAWVVIESSVWFLDIAFAAECHSLEENRFGDE
jgi:hypothetical protein